MTSPTVGYQDHWIPVLSDKHTLALAARTWICSRLGKISPFCGCSACKDPPPRPVCPGTSPISQTPAVPLAQTRSEFRLSYARGSMPHPTTDLFFVFPTSRFRVGSFDRCRVPSIHTRRESTPSVCSTYS